MNDFRKRPDVIAKWASAVHSRTSGFCREQSVLENVMVANHVNLKSSLFGSVVNTPLYRREEREQKEKSLYLLERVGLSNYANSEVGSLPYGMQRKLEIAAHWRRRQNFLPVGRACGRHESKRNGKSDAFCE